MYFIKEKYVKRKQPYNHSVPFVFILLGHYWSDRKGLNVSFFLKYSRIKIIRYCIIFCFTQHNNIDIFFQSRARYEQIFHQYTCPRRLGVGGSNGYTAFNTDQNNNITYSYCVSFKALGYWCCHLKVSIQVLFSYFMCLFVCYLCT